MFSDSAVQTPGFFSVQKSGYQGKSLSKVYGLCIDLSLPFCNHHHDKHANITFLPIWIQHVYIENKLFFAIATLSGMNTVFFRMFYEATKNMNP